MNYEKLKEEIKNKIESEEKKDFYKEVTRIGMNAGLELALLIIDRLEREEKKGGNKWLNGEIL